MTSWGSFTFSNLKMPKTYKRRRSTAKRSYKGKAYKATSRYASMKFFRSPSKFLTTTFKRNAGDYTLQVSQVSGNISIIDITGTSVPSAEINYPPSATLEPSSGASLGALPTVFFPVSVAFNLSNMANYREITDLYDEYQIVGAKVTFQPLFAPASGVGGSATNIFGAIPEVIMAPDFNDNSIADAYPTLISREGVKRSVLMGHAISMGVKPRPASQLYDSNGLVPVGYGFQQRQPWIDSKSVNVPHYGVKCYFRNLNIQATGGTVPPAYQPNVYQIRVLIDYIVRARRMA